MPVRIESGGAAAIASGEVTSFFGAPITVHLEEWRFEVVLILAQDDGDVRLDVQSDDDRIRLTAFNFDEGRGTAEPIAIVRRGDIGLWLHFRVFRYGTSIDHTVHYTVWGRRVEDPD